MMTQRVRRRSSFVLLAVLLLLAAFIGGCGQKAGEKQPAETGKGKDVLTGSITIAGSTSIQPFSEVLAESFQKKNPGVAINVQGGGSSQGIEAALSGAADIGSSSRELKPEEQGKGLVETRIALDGIAVIVHPSNKVGNMKMDDIRNIYLGNITNWKDVGGENAPINVVCREEGSGTRGAFEDIVMNKEKISNKVIIQNSTGAVRTTVAGDPKAIGFVSLASLNNEVKAVTIDGVEASVENVKNGSYKISRPFLYLTKGEARGLAKSFIDYVLSEEGQSIMVDEGAISIK